MLGAVFGNIIGSAYEGKPVDTRDFLLKLPRTRYTEDTVMTLAVAKWLMEDPDHSRGWLVHCMQKLGRGHIRAGMDENLRDWLMSKDPKPHNAWDCKAALRISSIGLYAETLDETRELARLAARVTNNHPESVREAMAVAECVFLNRNRTDYRSSLAEVKEAIRKRIAGEYGYDLSQTLEEMRMDLSSDSRSPARTTQAISTFHISVQRAITVFLKSGSLEDCVRNAIYIGGTPGTIAAIACSIFAACKDCWDVPLMSQFERYLPYGLQNIMGEFEGLVFPTKPTFHSFKVTDNIYAGEYPRDRDEDRSVFKMKQFERFSINHFIDLTEEGELASYKEFLSISMSHSRFPFPDQSVPESTDKVRKLMWEIDQIIRATPNIKIYIHCWGGVGRTGTIVGCMLAHQMGYDCNQAIASLRQLFKDCPKSSYRIIPETEGQCRFIARFIEEEKNTNDPK